MFRPERNNNTITVHLTPQSFSLFLALTKHSRNLLVTVSHSFSSSRATFPFSKRCPVPFSTQSFLSPTMQSSPSYQSILLTPPISPYWPTAETPTPTFSVSQKIRRHFSFSEYGDEDISEMCNNNKMTNRGTTTISPPPSVWCERVLRDTSEFSDLSNHLSDDFVLSPLIDLSNYRGGQLSVASPPISIWHPTYSVTNSLFSETDNDITSYLSNDMELLSSSCDGSYPEIPREILFPQQSKRKWRQICRFPFQFFKKKCRSN
jgi:hypothetical protein